MKKRIISVLSLALCLCMLMSFAGCGGGGNSAGKVGDLVLEDTAQEKLFESARGTTITHIVEGEPNDYTKTILAELEQRYGIKVKFMKMGYSEYTSKIAQMVATGSPPDTAVMTDALALNYIYANIAQPLNDYMDLEDKYWDKDILAQFTVDGKIYGVNTGDVDTFFIYYNKTLFEENNIEDPYTLYKNGEWTFDKLREIAKKATLYEDDNKTVKCHGFATWYREVFVLANGGNIIGLNTDTGMYESVVSDKKTVTGLNMIKNLAMDGSFDPAIAGYAEFPKREVAMLCERPANVVGNYDLYNTMDDEIGVVPLPKGPDADKTYAASNMIVNYVPVNAKNPVGGMAWNYYWLRRETEGYIQKDAAAVARIGKMMNEEHYGIINGYLDEATKISSKLDSLMGWSNYSASFWGGLVNDGKSAEEVVATMDNTLKSALERTIGK